MDDPVADLIAKLHLPDDAGQVLRDVVRGLKPGVYHHPTILPMDIDPNDTAGMTLVESNDSPFGVLPDIFVPILPAEHPSGGLQARTSDFGDLIDAPMPNALRDGMAAAADTVGDSMVAPAETDRTRTTRGTPPPASIRGGSGDAATVERSSTRDTRSWNPENKANSGDFTKTPAGRNRLTRRFDELGLLGAGGMGEVYRVLDRDFNRLLALKVIRPELANSSRALSRFIAEAQVTGQLQHPGIVPVHEMGRLPDGRMFFAMREVRGRDLGTIIAEVHAAHKPGIWAPTASGWTFRKLIDAFLTACEAVAYAHSRRVIHRDLKPENILLGDYGQVLVVDWGLARVLDQNDQDDFDDITANRVVTQRTKDASKETQVGSVAGTPAYMPIEQAKGERGRQGPHTDVYSLGACLYEILSGEPPYLGPDPDDILRQVVAGPAAPLPDNPDIPDALRQICNKAMAREPAERFVDANALAKEVAAFLEGARRREQALAHLQQAQERSRSIGRLQTRAAALKEEAEKLLQGIPANAAVDRKRVAWARLDEARRLEHGAEVLEAVVTQLASAALAQSPELPEAHAFLSDHYQRNHAAAEARGASAAAERFRILLQAHDTGRYARYLQGDGAVTLHTVPSGAQVEVFKYVTRDRRLEREPMGIKRTTPLVKMQLPMGSYVLVITAPGRVPVQYPVWIRREEHWDGVPPGQSEPMPIVLPTIDQIDDDEVYVPGGWFWSGHDPDRGGMPRERVWIDPFVMEKYPVTNYDYLEFLNDLAHRWREAEALQFVPAVHPGLARMEPDRSGAWQLGKDAEGRPLGADWPVTMIDWRASVAHASWRTVREGRQWWLPYELQWEKAARGVDGRIFPWGPFLDPTWTCMVETHSGRALPAGHHRFPEDESPYGVRGMGGNVRDWCRDTWIARGPRIRDGKLINDRSTTPEGPLYRAVRGGSWSSRAEDCRTVWRTGIIEDDKLPDVGFRLVRQLSDG
jgi:serine/threonine protein kinase/formylglycine-generating enzyme required for sulfatase activity